MSLFKKTKTQPSLTVLLIRPSKYDDDGYVIRYWKGVLPSNTLACLHALTRQAFDSGRFDHISTEIVLLDDTVQDIEIDDLARRYLGPNRKAIAGLVGVQSNQFPRAADLARRFQKAGFMAMMGGFHVSGSIALAQTMPAECQALLDDGVTLVKGEVEDVWGDILKDAWEGRLQPFYNIEEKPDITNAPIPRLDTKYQKRFVFQSFGTIDAGRGCPYNCSFCTIINVQGRKMRCRSAESIVQQVVDNYRTHQVLYYFFTDDNFARNRNWEQILDGLIDLRENHKMLIEFMMQVDTKAWKIPRFMEKATRAGCTQVFLGVESLNSANLEAADKHQNSVDDMAEMVNAWHEAGTACHAGYIIGFPFDTPESVALDVEKLKGMGLDQCSFFMLTPLPGSMDHVRLMESGAWIEPDFNRFDSFHETTRHPNFKEGEWLETYEKAWHSFCSPEHMRGILSRCNDHTYWGIFKNFMWYRSALFEGIHPMISGLWRLKPRTDRRPGAIVQGRLGHAWRRAGESARAVKFYARLFLELQDLWLQTRIRHDVNPRYLQGLRDNVSQWSENLGNRASEMRHSLEERGTQARDWLQDGAHDLSGKVRARFSGLQTMGAIQGGILNRRISRTVVHLNRAGKLRYVTTRAQLDDYWRRVSKWVRQGRVIRVSVETPRIAWNLLREMRLGVAFAIYFMHELTID